MPMLNHQPTRRIKSEFLDINDDIPRLIKVVHEFIDKTNELKSSKNFFDIPDNTLQSIKNQIFKKYQF